MPFHRGTTGNPQLSLTTMKARVELTFWIREWRILPVVAKLGDVLFYIFNMIDVALVNSFLLMEGSGYSKCRATFIKDVALQLADGNIKSRYNSKMIYSQIRSAFTDIGLPSQFINTAPQDHKPKKCQERNCRKSTRKMCSGCSKYVCSNHHRQNILCASCML